MMYSNFQIDIWCIYVENRCFRRHLKYTPGMDIACATYALSDRRS